MGQIAISYQLPQPAARRMAEQLEAWRTAGNVQRLWEGDRSLWTGRDEDRWLGWLRIVDEEQRDLRWMEALASRVGELGTKDVVLLGMGGSSLGPQVLSDVLRPGRGQPQFHMLDSTVPAQVARLERSIDLDATLFIVSSKSGTTLEPNIFRQYFFGQVAQLPGVTAGNRFVAITDPGSEMERIARADGFLATFRGEPSIGGRYSVLSKFGLVPAAAIGLDVARLLAEAREMAQSCSASVPPAANPGVRLGIALGALAGEGRDKITVLAGPGLESAGAWLEQLIGESTGKEGRGLIPIDLEPIGPPAAYGADRVFSYIHLIGADDLFLERQIAALAQAGQPVIDIGLAGPYQIAQLFFLWEMAIATVGAVVQVNPFDQPDVEASKLKAREITRQFEKTGALPKEEPFFRTQGVALYADAVNRKALGPARSLEEYLRAHFARTGAGDYAALLAYIDHSTANASALQAMRSAIRDRKQVATCVGFGPRFLHSTGQAYKGGPNTGVFLQITCDDPADLQIPGQGYTFGVVKAAQARGDFEVLAERGRRALHVHLDDAHNGLKTLAAALESALET